MAVLSWGKPRIFIKNLDAESPAWKEVPTPAQDSTTLESTKGDKVEAKFEGGENEDVRYNANTYALSYQIRHAKGKTMPFTPVDGLIAGTYALALLPEDPAAPGLMIDKSVVSSEDTYTSADGLSTTYTHDALKPDTGNQVKIGVVTVQESGGSVSSISIDEDPDWEAA